MIDEIDFMTIEEHKKAGDWPLEWLPVKSLIPYIKRLGPCVGIEVGVARGESSYHILDKCENVTKLYGIDPYPEYEDWNGKVTLEHSEKTKEIMKKNMHSFIESDRFVHINLTSKATMQVDGFDEKSMDFIFVDGDHSYEGVKFDLEYFYSLMKPGGIFAGHDYNLISVRRALEEFREQNKIRVPINSIDNYSWFWYVPS